MPVSSTARRRAPRPSARPMRAEDGAAPTARADRDLRARTAIRSGVPAPRQGETGNAPRRACGMMPPCSRRFHAASTARRRWWRTTGARPATRYCLHTQPGSTGGVGARRRAPGRAGTAGVVDRLSRARRQRTVTRTRLPLGPLRRRRARHRRRPRPRERGRARSAPATRRAAAALLRRGARATGDVRPVVVLRAGAVPVGRADGAAATTSRSPRAPGGGGRCGRREEAAPVVRVRGRRSTC